MCDGLWLVLAVTSTGSGVIWKVGLHLRDYLDWCGENMLTVGRSILWVGILDCRKAESELNNGGRTPSVSIRSVLWLAVECHRFLGFPATVECAH